MHPLFPWLFVVPVHSDLTPIPVDLDADGAPDLVWVDGDGRLRILHRRDPASLEPREVRIDLAGALPLAWRDLDGDGDPDLLACDGHGPRLFENVGPFTFEEVPGAGGLADAGLGQARWTDLDGDGSSDLFWGTADAARLYLHQGGLEFRLAGEFPSEVPRPVPASVSAALPQALPALCAGSLHDLATGACLHASSTALLGNLYPLSLDLNVSPAGNVGIGTTAPLEKLHVAGAARADGGLRFGDGTLQTSAGTRQWSQLVGTPAGFADGIDDDTLYTAAAGLTLAAGAFGFDTGFGDARYWNESQPLAGDLGGTAGSASVTRLQGRSVSASPPVLGQVLKWTGTTWGPQSDTDTNTTYSAGTGLALGGTTFSVANGGVASGQLALDPASLERVSALALGLSSSRLIVNGASPTGRVNVRHGSGTGNPHLALTQDGASAFARIGLDNTASAQSWTIAGGLTATPADDRLNFFHSSAGDVLSVTGQGRVGIGTTTPVRELHVAGDALVDGTLTTGGGNVSLATGGLTVDGATDSASLAPDRLQHTGPDFEVRSNNLLTLVGQDVVLDGDDITLDAANDVEVQAASRIDIRTAGTTRLRVQSSGDVGIGTVTPQFLLHVNGTAGKPGGGSWAMASDERLKRDIGDLEGALETLLALRGVTFEYRDPEAIGELPGQRMGFIAQEVEQVLPDWVSEGPDGYKRMTVRGFEALAVEALRELHRRSEAQQERLDRLERELGELRAQLTARPDPASPRDPAKSDG